MTHLSIRKRLVLGAGLVGLLAPAALLAEAPSSLRDQLARRHDLIQRQAKAPPAQPETLRARVTAESRSGVRRLRIRNFQYLSDSGRDFGGYNLGAGSWDTEVAVLASAIADEFAIQAAAQGLPVDGIDVLFTSHPDDASVEKQRKVAYPRNLSYVAYIDSPASDAQLQALRSAVENTSPVLALITKGYPIPHGKIELTASAAQRDPNLPPGLRDFLVEKRGAILRRDAAAAKNPPQPYALRAVATVEPATGIRTTRTGEGDFQIVHDSRKEFGGYGLAPTVEEHQVGVLGTCLTHIFEIQAATRQVVLDSLEVRVQGDLSSRVGAGASQAPRYSNLQYTVHIESPASAADIDGLRQAVEASCPVYNLLKDGQAVKGSVVRGRYADQAPAAARP